MNTLEAYETVAWSETLLARLDAAIADLSKKQGFKDEKVWLTAAVDRVQAARGSIGDILSRVMRLPEMEAVREDHARSLQNAAIDVVERLQAGITFHAGARTPLLEVLYGKLKLPMLRRVDREDFERFCGEFEKRLNSSYVKRMLGDPGFLFAMPVVDQVRDSFVAWRAAFTGDRLPEGEEQTLRDELVSIGKKLDLPMRQARLLAEAALVGIKDAFENSGIGQKPKRRVKSAITEVDESMVDVSEDETEDEEAAEAGPTPEEAAELAAAEAQVAAPAPEVIEEAPKKPKAKRVRA